MPFRVFGLLNSLPLSILAPPAPDIRNRKASSHEPCVPAFPDLLPFHLIREGKPVAYLNPEWSKRSASFLSLTTAAVI
ncbi:hypothetical protein H9L39_06537 [Fusarium oxysporum f. sp. albedinis]|nr:hypothetical protein H9L39_06537 [Fusarium oxysporum f. sp. albedinis]